MKRKGRVAALIVLAQLICTGAALAADFPNRPIRIVVPFNPGSGADETARVYGEIVSKLAGQSVLVENKPGASGLLAIRDRVDAAKKEKRSLVVGNYSAGYNLIAAWLGTAAGVEITHVPYKGGAQMVTDVLGPVEMREFQVREHARFKRVADAAGIKPQ